MYKLAFLIPHYNHTQNLEILLKNLSVYDADIIIIDDASDEIHKQKLQNLNATIIYKSQNGGKGSAVKLGFSYLIKHKYTHAIQVDADMQHDISGLDRFIKLSKENPKALICANPIYGNDAPKSRLYGRKITNFWAIINSLSFELKDSMCGLRLYPLEKVHEILRLCKADRMDFDIDILMLLYRSGVKILWVDVAVRYDNDGVSHFKMLRDNLLISKTHAKFFFTLLNFILKRLLK